MPPWWGLEELHLSHRARLVQKDPDFYLPLFGELPDLPDVSVPGWVEAVLDKVKYVWPVVLAFVLARAEINRRRKQDELRAQARDEDA